MALITMSALKVVHRGEVGLVRLESSTYYWVVVEAILGVLVLSPRPLVGAWGASIFFFGAAVYSYAGLEGPCG